MKVTEKLDASAPEGQALEAFFVVHYGRLVGLAGLVCGDVAFAEDIVQNALERAWRSRSALRDADRLRPWLDRIVVREAARERRSRLVWLGRIFRPPSVREIEIADRRLDDGSGGRLPERAAMQQAFAGLSVAQRAVVVMHLHAGYSVDETAEALGVPRETVRSRLRVAREHLRRALKEGD
jgi:RNA polymerase sigma-70 factor (ECF subfamily)